MKALKEAIHVALRDDATATVGIRALLGHNATPYGVYQHHFPETPDFAGGKSYITWYLLPGTGSDGHGNEVRLREVPVAITAWSSNPDTVEDIHARVRARLENLRNVTLPTADVQLFQIKLENTGTDLFDDDYKVYYRTEQYRTWYRDDITN